MMLDAWTQVDRVAHDLLRPLTTEAQYAQALEVIDSLMERIGDSQDDPLLTLLELLVERVHAYEEVRHALPDAPPNRLLEFLMDQNDLTQSAVAEATGINQSNLSKLIRGDREFNTQHIKALSEFFHVSPAVFIA
jgi:HTH-type transcriptional regulator/antitoxin HigA